MDTKRAYLKELRIEQWKEEQREELWNAIRTAFLDICEPRKEYWMNRLYAYYCRRFHLITKVSWLVFLGELDDEAAYGEYRCAKARKYCCRVRDAAWWLTHPAEEKIERICEPVDYIWAFRLAS